MSDSKLKAEHKIFVEQYVIDWNGSRAYKVAYPNVTDGTARANSSKLLTNTNIIAYIEEIQKDLQKQAGISFLKVANEFQKIAFSTLHNYKKDWVTLKEWDEISEDDKAAISEYQHTEMSVGKDSGKAVMKTVIKFKLHDKQKALENLSKMFGYNAPTKIANTDTEGNDIIDKRLILEVVKPVKKIKTTESEILDLKAEDILNERTDNETN